MIEFLAYLFFKAKFWLFYTQICLAYSWLFWPLAILAVCGAFVLGVCIERWRFCNRIRNLLDQEWWNSDEEETLHTL